MASTTAHFDTRDPSLQRELRDRVDEYFARTGQHKHGDGRMVAKTFFFAFALAGLWVLGVSGVVPAAWGLLVCVALGFVLAGVGFNIGHDAIHGAYSRRGWVNKLLAHSFDVMGASSYTWSRAHNLVHHTYTNITGVDHDLEPGPFLRLYPKDRPAWGHRFQHLYALFLYAFTGVVWVFKKDFEQALGRDLRTGKRAPLREVVKLSVWKLIHLSLFVFVPWAVSPFSFLQVLVGYFVMQAIVGLTAAIVFQLAHVVEATHFVAAHEPGKESWAAHQLRTTANFAIDNPVARFYCGGLTHQVEHHLFARICHVHYPALSKIVREVAEKHGLPYHHNPTFFGALRSHLRVLKKNGVQHPLSSDPLPA